MAVKLLYYAGLEFIIYIVFVIQNISYSNLGTNYCFFYRFPDAFRWLFVRFYPRDAMLGAGIAMAIPSVCLSVTRVLCIKTANFFCRNPLIT